MKELRQKAGHPPLHRIPVVDHKGNMRGHVGRTATAATASRFLGRPGAALGKFEGRTAWIGDPPPPPQMPAKGAQTAAGTPNEPKATKASLEISFKGGAVKAKPKPKAKAKPKK